MKTKTTLKKHTPEVAVNVMPRVMFMGGPASKLEATVAPQVIVLLERVYQNLFRNPANATDIANIRAALALYDGSVASREPVDAILQRLNDGEFATFSGEQLNLLKEILESSYEISPLNANADLALVGRRFFHALVFGSVDQVRDLWQRLHEYSERRNDPAARAHVVELLTIMVPNSEWSDLQLNALCILAVTDQRNRSLAWWDTVNDAW